MRRATWHIKIISLESGTQRESSDVIFMDRGARRTTGQGPFGSQNRPIRCLRAGFGILSPAGIFALCREERIVRLLCMLCRPTVVIESHWGHIGHSNFTMCCIVDIVAMVVGT